jgi:hypothetical protein
MNPMVLVLSSSILEFDMARNAKSKNPDLVRATVHNLRCHFDADHRELRIYGIAHRSLLLCSSRYESTATRPHLPLKPVKIRGLASTKS